MSNRRNGYAAPLASARGITWSAWLVAVFIGVPSLGFAVVSGLFNAAYAARFGHDSQERMTWVAASVLVTCFVTGLPLAIEVLRARVPHLAAVARGLWLSSMAFSFVAAMGYAALTRGRAAAEADASLKDRASLERAIGRSEAELAALPRHRPARAVQADLRKAEGEAGVNCSKARGPRAHEFCAPVLSLRAELAAAEEAGRIEARLEDQRGRLNSLAVRGKSANPQADMLAWLGGGLLAADTWERLVTVFAAALIELSAALGLAITARSVAELVAAAPVEIAPSTEAMPPEAPLTATAAIEPDAGFQRWSEATVTLQNGSRVTPRNAYAHYEAWAGMNGAAKLLSYHTFGRRMAEFVTASGGKLGNSGGRYYGGIALVTLKNQEQEAAAAGERT